MYTTQGHKNFDHNENNFIHSKTIRLTGKYIEKWKLQLKIVKTQIFNYRFEVSEIFGFIYNSPVIFLCTNHYSRFTLTYLVILTVIVNTRHIYLRIVNPFPI